VIYLEKKYTSALFSQQSKSSLWLAEAMAKYFGSVDHYDIRKVEVSLSSKGTEVIYEGKAVPEYDCLHVKGSFRFVDVLRTISQQFEGKCYNPINPEAYTIGHDKLLTHLKLQTFNIPMPTTYLSPSTVAGRKILEKINYPIVMKFPKGTQGKGVMFADSYAAASSMLDALETLRQPFLIQEYVDTDGSDIRAIVIGDKVAASMKRHAVEREIRANIHAGGKGEPVILDSHTRRIAIETAKAVGAEICAVDMLDGLKGALVIEVNLSPGLQGITACTGIDVADRIARFLFERTHQYKTSSSRDSTKKMMDGLTQIPKDQVQEIITNLDLRGNRILLPDIVQKVAEFEAHSEVILKVQAGKVSVERLNMG